MDTGHSPVGQIAFPGSGAIFSRLSPGFDTARSAMANRATTRRLLFMVCPAQGEASDRLGPAGTGFIHGSFQAGKCGTPGETEHGASSGTMQGKENISARLSSVHEKIHALQVTQRSSSDEPTAARTRTAHRHDGKTRATHSFGLCPAGRTAGCSVGWLLVGPLIGNGHIGCEHTMGSGGLERRWL